MLANARQRLQDRGLDAAGLIVGDCRKTGYDDDAFDIVVCLGVISYIEDYDGVLLEIRRVLKPGGTAFVSFRSKSNRVFSDRVAMAKAVGKKLLRRMTPEVFEIGRYLDHREVHAKMLDLGFRYADFVGIGFGPLRFQNRVVLSDRTSIRLNRGLARSFQGLGWSWPFKWVTDISLWIYTNPVP